MVRIDISDVDLETLNGQVIIITGGSSGIGLATITTILQHSPQAIIINGDLSPPESFSHPQVTYTHCDVTSWPSQRALFQSTLDAHSRIDHVFANAGITTRTSYLEDDLESGASSAPVSLSSLSELQEPDALTLAVNLHGAIATSKLALFVFRHQPPSTSSPPVIPSLTLSASLSAFTCFGAVDYATSKHAVLGLMRALLPHTWPRLPVRVNAVAPGWTESKIVVRDVLEGVGLRVQTPEDVGSGVAWLMAGKGSSASHTTTRSVQSSAVGKDGEVKASGERGIDDILAGQKGEKHGLVVLINGGEFFEIQDGLHQEALRAFTEAGEDAPKMLEVHDELMRATVGNQSWRNEKPERGADMVDAVKGARRG